MAGVRNQSNANTTVGPLPQPTTSPEPPVWLHDCRGGEQPSQPPRSRRRRPSKKERLRRGRDRDKARLAALRERLSSSEDSECSSSVAAEKLVSQTAAAEAAAAAAALGCLRHNASDEQATSISAAVYASVMALASVDLASNCPVCSKSTSVLPQQFEIYDAEDVTWQSPSSGAAVSDALGDSVDVAAGCSGACLVPSAMIPLDSVKTPLTLPGGEAVASPAPGLSCSAPGLEDGVDVAQHQVHIQSAGTTIGYDSQHLANTVGPSYIKPSGSMPSVVPATRPMGRPIVGVSGIAPDTTINPAGAEGTTILPAGRPVVGVSGYALDTTINPAVAVHNNPGGEAVASPAPGICNEVVTDNGITEVIADNYPGGEAVASPAPGISSCGMATARCSQCGPDGNLKESNSSGLANSHEPVSEQCGPLPLHASQHPSDTVPPSMAHPIGSDEAIRACQIELQKSMNAMLAFMRPPA